MSIHNFRIKRSKNFASQFFKLKPSHLAFLHETASQHLGSPPSALYGHPVPFRFDAAPKTWQYVQHAAKQPVHEFGRLMHQHADTSIKAAGLVSSIFDAVARNAGTVGKYIGKAGAFALKHQQAIGNAINIGSKMISTGAELGLVHKPFADLVNVGNQALQDYRNRKTGGAIWSDYNTLLPL